MKDVRKLVSELEVLVQSLRQDIEKQGARLSWNQEIGRKIREISDLNSDVSITLKRQPGGVWEHAPMAD